MIAPRRWHRALVVARRLRVGGLLAAAGATTTVGARTLSPIALPGGPSGGVTLAPIVPMVAVPIQVAMLDVGFEDAERTARRGAARVRGVALWALAVGLGTHLLCLASGAASGPATASVVAGQAAALTFAGRAGRALTVVGAVGLVATALAGHSPPLVVALADEPTNALQFVVYTAWVVAATSFLRTTDSTRAASRTRARSPRSRPKENRACLDYRCR